MHQSIEYAQYKAQRIKELIPGFNRPGISILDFGCADGLMTFYLQELFFESNVVGIDQASEKIVQAQKNFPHVAFQTINTFFNTTWDAIILADVLHHVPCKDQVQLMQNLMGVLKPDGFCIVLEINPWNLSSRLAFNNNPEEKNAQMLSPWYAWHLLRKFGKTKLFSFSFPWPFYYAENILCRIPLGAFYAVKVHIKH